MRVLRFRSLRGVLMPYGPIQNLSLFDLSLPLGIPMCRPALSNYSPLAAETAVWGAGGGAGGTGCGASADLGDYWHDGDPGVTSADGTVDIRGVHTIQLCDEGVGSRHVHG